MTDKKGLTLRGIDAETLRILKIEAARQGVSLNELILKLMDNKAAEIRKAAGEYVNQ